MGTGWRSHVRKRQHQLALAIIVVVTGFSVFVTWPGNPDKYLPDFIPWPDGGGLNIAGFDRDEFRLGLDLAGGVSVTLEASGTAVQVRPGETLLELARRLDVVSTIAADIVTLNAALLDANLAEGDFDKTLRDVTQLTIPAALSPQGSDDLFGPSTVEAEIVEGESLLDFVKRQDVAALLKSLNPELAGLEADELGQPLPDGMTSLVVPLELTDTDLQDAVEEARIIIEERVNGFGVSETEVTVLGDDRINAQIPGVTAEEAADLVGSTALLEFREIDPRQQSVPIPVDEFGARQTIFDIFDQDLSIAEARVTTFVAGDPDEDVIVLGGTRWIPARALNSQGEETQLTGRFLISNSIQRTLDSSGNPSLIFEFNEEGAVLFERLTERLSVTQAPLGIFVDRQRISSPTVQAVISDRGTITGLSVDDATRLRRQLRAGALPINFEVIQQTEVAATLGEDSVVDTVQAGLVAFIAIVVFMIVYYRLPGVLAALALLVYAAMVMATFKLIPVTLTLAGIAGFVLSVGLAVDANILIFERMKEELRLGRSLLGSIETGWARAWPAIRDANVSTLITVVILWIFADALNANLIKSFAIALGIGTLFSMVSAIFVTRTFLNLVVDVHVARRPWLFGLREMAGEDEEVGSSQSASAQGGGD